MGLVERPEQAKPWTLNQAPPLGVHHLKIILRLVVGIVFHALQWGCLNKKNPASFIINFKICI